ncbi:hypothetical protein HDU91_004428 [Kappamyces sp. JEL0680]|nr:hypothetical protein HDU91_004428 [Kappamyces sp. JEL0680]
MFRGMLAKDQDSVEAVEAQDQQKSGVASLWNAPVSSKAVPTSWESLLVFICDLYGDREDVAAAWWTEPELAQFIKISSDVWHSRFLIRFVKMLEALSCGVASSSQAHLVLYTDSPGLLSNLNWGTFFRSINSYTDKLMQPDNSAMELNPAESSLIISMLGLASTVVKYSVAARRVLCENQNYSALDSLFNLLTTRLQVDMKAALINTIASFCTPPTDGFDVTFHIWNYMEYAQIIPTVSEGYFDASHVGTYGIGSEHQSSARGLVFDLKEIETPMKTYTETMAYLHLVKMLLSSASKDPDSVFDSLGVPNRVGGIRPYISFIIDEVFMKIDDRQFIDPEERGMMLCLCLEIFNLCLEKLDTSTVLSYLAEQRQEAFSAAVNVTNPLYASLRSLGIHPGFDILCRLLNGSRFCHRILNIIETYGETLPNRSDGIAQYSSLRIVYFVLQIQGSFLGVIAPAIVEAKEANFLQLPTSMSGLESHMASRKQVIVRIAALVNHEYNLIALLSIDILFMISKSSIFSGVDQSEPMNRTNRLVGVLESSTESIQIQQGFSDRINVDAIENSLADEIFTGVQNQYEGSPLYFDPSSLSHSIDHTIRLTILDMLIWNISSKLSPNIAHFLLGLSVGNTGTDEDAPMPRTGALSVIVDLLFQGEIAPGSLEESHSFQKPFYVTHSLLAEKCYHLIYLLCSDAATGTQTLRYLRNDCDFFVRQLSRFSPVQDNGVPDDGSTEQIVVRLHQCAWLLKSVSLELHLAALTGQRSQSQRLLNLLFTSSSSQLLQATSAFELPLTKAAGILQFLNMTESSLPPLDLSQTIFSGVNLADYMKNDDRGTEIFDVQTLFLTLTSFVNYLEGSGSIIHAGGRAGAFEIISQIMDHILEKNRGQQISSARFHCMQSWCSLIRVSIKGYFDLFSPELRERRIFELLTSLLQRIGNDKTSLSIGTCVSQAVLALISRLDHDRQTRIMVELDSSGGHQMDSVNSAILQGILDGLQVPGSSASMRGNYYASLMIFIRFANSDDPHSREYSQETASIIAKLPNRFWELLCRDASDSELIWQTVAFATLGSLCQTANWGHAANINSQYHPLLNFLTKRNFLGHFIRTINQFDDGFLKSIIVEGSDEHENIRFVFETKMTLLLRISETKVGSDRLLEYGVMESLADCQYLDQIPRRETDRNPGSVVLVDTTDKFFSITNPAFELIASITSHYSSDHVAVTKKVVSFCNAHCGLITSTIRTALDSLSISVMSQLKLITGILFWLGATFESVHQLGTRNEIASSLQKLLLVFSESKWMAKIQPQNDIEQAKALSIIPFTAGSGKRSIFLEEAIRLSEEICRNITGFLLKNHANVVKSQALSVSYDYIAVLRKFSEHLLQYLGEKESLALKLIDVNQVAVDEVNEIQYVVAEKLAMLQMIERICQRKAIGHN